MGATTTAFARHGRKRFGGCLIHWHCGFADGYDEHAVEFGDRNRPTRKGEHVPVACDALLHGSLNVHGAHGGGEDGTGCRAQFRAQGNLPPVRSRKTTEARTCAKEQGQCRREQAASVAMRAIQQPSGGIGTEKSADVADGVDGGNAKCGTRRREALADGGPKDRHGGKHANGRERQCDRCPCGVRREGGCGESGSGSGP